MQEHLRRDTCHGHGPLLQQTLRSLRLRAMHMDVRMPQSAGCVRAASALDVHDL
jgi:hypothetical protein